AESQPPKSHKRDDNANFSYDRYKWTMTGTPTAVHQTSHRICDRHQQITPHRLRHQTAADGRSMPQCHGYPNSPD
ncbi:hypothetical protein BaRGS_00029059, partial [Batillaria attramentaria]